MDCESVKPEKYDDIADEPSCSTNSDVQEHMLTGKNRWPVCAFLLLVSSTSICLVLMFNCFKNGLI